MPTFIDLSHDVREGMITYPGLPAPRLGSVLSRADSRGRYAEGVEFDIGLIELCTNTGTYLDTPFHRYADGHDLTGLPLERCVDLPIVVVDATPGVAAIGLAHFTPEVLGRLRGGALLLRSGWDAHWGALHYFHSDHPFLAPDAIAEWK